MQYMTRHAHTHTIPKHARDTATSRHYNTCFKNYQWAQHTITVHVHVSAAHLVGHTVHGETTQQHISELGQHDS